jgi:predicted nucleic acid-binding protein
MKVIDASSLIEFLTETERGAAIAVHLDDDLFAPDLLIAEVHHHLRRLERSDVATSADVERCARQLADAPIQYVHIWPYSAQVFEWRHNIGAYDAMYVAIAADLRCPLLTSDHRLATAAAGLVSVISI